MYLPIHETIVCLFVYVSVTVFLSHRNQMGENKSIVFSLDNIVSNVSMLKIEDEVTKFWKQATKYQH